MCDAFNSGNSSPVSAGRWGVSGAKAEQGEFRSSTSYQVFSEVVFRYRADPKTEIYVPKSRIWNNQYISIRKNNSEIYIDMRIRLVLG